MAKPIILAVDDDPDVLSAIIRDLRKNYGRDYRILRADSGSSALELLTELSDTDAPVDGVPLTVEGGGSGESPC